jgi:anti-anti-sigma factor
MMPAKVELTGNIARIILSGNLDFSTQEELVAAIDQALSIDAAKEIQVDMADAIFIDSSAIRALLNLQEMAKRKEKSLSIWNCSEPIRETFAIGGFDRLFVLR